MAETRACQRCGQNRQLRFFKPTGRVCLPCQKRNRKGQVRRLHVAKAYNLTEKQHKALVDFDHGRCHGCQETRIGNLCIDHDHTTGLVRGLLCRRCNRVLGIMRDNAFALERLSEYLVDPPAERLGIRVEVNKDVAERPRRSRRQWR